MGLDPDWDGKLTPEEEARLSGFDMKWDPEFPAIPMRLQGEAPLALSRPGLDCRLCRRQDHLDPSAQLRCAGADR
jgi:hypothetical protein